jgi:hypothetical protein
MDCPVTFPVLPAEMWAHVCLFCDPHQLSRLSTVNRMMNKIITKNQKLWHLALQKQWFTVRKKQNVLFV